MFGRLIFSCLFCLFLVSEGAFAWGSLLEKQVLSSQKFCPKLNCPELAVQVVALSTSELKDLGKDKRAQMKKMATTMARDLWPDTILEGPFTNTFRFRVENLQKLTIDGQFAGYRITYSDKAWDLDTCEADLSELDKCKAGRIYEAAFIDPDLQVVFRDEKAMAEFIADSDPQPRRLF